MKLVVLVFLGSMFAQGSFACVDISGDYMMGAGIKIRYEQVACESLTEKWCVDDCANVAGYTWPLNGQMIQDGGNPSKWASITPEAETLRRTNLWESGTRYDGTLCWWKELTYSKNEKNNLVVTFNLECPSRAGETKKQQVSEEWVRF